MDPYADHSPGQRVRWLTRLACLWAAILLARLIYLQVAAHAGYREQALSQQMQRREVKPSRGFIFDRNGRPLAMSLPVETITVSPKQLPDTGLAAHLLASVLELDASELRAKLDGAVANRRGYMVVAKNVDPAKAGRLRNLGVDWISFEREGVRKYPNGPMAAHVLGGVDFEERGNAGVEWQFEDDLGGYPGYEWVVTDVKRRGYESTVETKPQTGKNLYLTLDRRIQHAADAAVRQAVIGNGCQSGTAVVMDPNSGDILAIANFPNYDPNAPLPAGKESARKNLAVGDPFEPGSIFKVFTIAAALEERVVQPQTPIDCQNGVLRMAGRVIHEAKGGYGILTVEEVLAKSSNIGAIRISQRLSEAKLHDYLMRFGFNRTTGIELPGESSGLIFRVNRWHPASIGSVAMGHEVLTTSIQLAQAASVIANNGMLVAPRLVTAQPPHGVPAQSMVQVGPPAAARRIIRPETAIAMRQMMEAVVLRGTGKSARLEGYTSGGKTGTAQLFDKTAQRYTHLYNASFMGFAPVTNPAIVVIVTLNRSTKYGGVIAAPVFRDIAQTALRVLNVPQDNFNPPMEEPSNLPSSADLAMVPLSSRDAAQLQADMQAEQDAARVTQIATGPGAPDFLGKPVRSVIEEAASRGVRVELIGTGLARQQEPPPGVRLISGQKVKVVFAR